jgi:hypothetical protein
MTDPAPVPTPKGVIWDANDPSSQIVDQEGNVVGIQGKPVPMSTRCEPAPEHRGREWHHVSKGEQRAIWRWHGDWWGTAMSVFLPTDVAQAGWQYEGVADGPR